MHKQYSKDYFETDKVTKVNLSKTFNKVLTEYILHYRLNLHESVNEYLYQADVKGYVGVHVYFQSNFYYPWELQIGNEKEASQNVKSHRLYKRRFAQK